jgi:ribosomal protein L40E
VTTRGNRGPVRRTSCPRCGSTDLFGPAPLRTSAHPNSSFLLIETPGAHFHDHPVQGTVCLECGSVTLVLTGPTLDALRAEVRPEAPKGKA